MTFDSFIQFKHYNNVFYLLQKNFIGKLVKKGKKIYALKLFNELKYFLTQKCDIERIKFIELFIVKYLNLNENNKFGLITPEKFEYQKSHLINGLLAFIKKIFSKKTMFD